MSKPVSVEVAPELWNAVLSALSARELSEDKHANCPEYEGEGEPEMCEVCFPFADDARLKMRYALDVSRGLTPISASSWELLSALKAAESILWMAEKYAEGGGSRGIEMETYTAAAEEINRTIAKAEAEYKRMKAAQEANQD